MVIKQRKEKKQRPARQEMWFIFCKRIRENTHARLKHHFFITVWLMKKLKAKMLYLVA